MRSEYHHNDHFPDCVLHDGGAWLAHEMCVSYLIADFFKKVHPDSCFEGLNHFSLHLNSGFLIAHHLKYNYLISNDFESHLFDLIAKLIFIMQSVQNLLIFPNPIIQNITCLKLKPIAVNRYLEVERGRRVVWSLNLIVSCNVVRWALKSRFGFLYLIIFDVRTGSL